MLIISINIKEIVCVESGEVCFIFGKFITNSCVVTMGVVNPPMSPIL